MNEYRITRPDSKEKISEIASQIFEFAEREMKVGNITHKSADELEIELFEGRALVAFQDQKPVGYVSFQLWDEEHIEVMTLVVDAPHRNNGLGWRLSVQMAEYLKAEFPEHKIIYLLKRDFMKIFEHLDFKRIFMQSLPQEPLRAGCRDCPEYGNYPRCSCKAMGLVRADQSFIFVLNLVDDPRDAERMARLYCDIWKEPPWNEDFWTTDGTLQDLEIQLQLKFAICLISKKDQQVTGFTWGYEVTQKKLREICGHSQLDYLFENGRRVYYIDELGVSKDARNEGTGTKLTEAITLFAKLRGQKVVTLRTDEKAESAISVYRKSGFEPLDIHDAEHPTRIYWVKFI